jgi:hypothetical protein
MSVGKPVCHFVLPGLTAAVSLLSQVDKLRLHSLETALRRGSQSVNLAGNEQLLAQLFDLDIDSFDHDVPIAALLAQQHAAVEILKSHQWLRASPVNLVPDRDRLVLHLPQQEFTDSISKFLDFISSQLLEIFSDVIEGVVISQQCLLFRLKGAERFITTPLNNVAGKHINGLLPAGDDASKWNVILNEMQMLLHQQKAPEIGFNAFWIDGCGSLPEPVQSGGVISSGKDELLIGLSNWQQCEHFSELENIESLENIENLMEQTQKLVVSEKGISQALLDRSLDNCLQAITHADSQLGRLLEWLDSGRLSAINLYLLDGRQYTIKKPNIWTFFKKKKMLSELCKTTK